VADGGEDRVQVRLALVLNGGVSLAVWMGGVVHEIDRLRRASADDPVYDQIQQIVGCETVVDLIAGSSAGGINGAALGCAVARDKRLRVHGAPLRDLWLETGNIAGLMRSVAERSPDSLLRGDDYMLPAMRGAFSDLLNTADGASRRDPAVTPLPPPDPGDHLTVEDELEQVKRIVEEERAHPTAVQLFLTGSLFVGEERFYEDRLGVTFAVPDNRLLFRFFRDPIVTGRDDFAGDPTERFALAARTTASFPVAFEPSEIDPGRFGPDQLTIGTPHFVMDGGVLDNEPFDPLLDQMLLRPSDGGRVARYIAYIVPYANVEALHGATTKPTVREVAFAVANLPRDVNIANDMERLLDLGGRAADNERSRVELLRSPTGALRTLARRQFPIYRAARRRDARTELGLLALGAHEGAGPAGGHEGAGATSPARVDSVPAADVETLVPSELATPPDGAWPWGFAAAERIVQNVLADVRDRIVKAAPADPSLPALRDRRARVGACLALIRRRNVEFSGMVAGPGPAPAANAYARFEKGLAILVRAAVEPALEPDYLERLLCVEVLQRTQRPELARPVEPFRFARFSADVGNALGVNRGPRSKANPEGSGADEKLAGLRLGHFGGFLKRSWRANDWLWGRLDGVEHLVRLLLAELAEIDDGWLARKGPALAAVALPDGVPAEFTRTLLDRAGFAPGTSITVARADIASAPDSLRDALIARIQLGVVCREVPCLIAQAGLDRTDGWRKDQPPLSLPSGMTDADVAQAEKDDVAEPFLQYAPALLSTFSAWHVRDQPIGAEATTPAFTTIATRAAAVGSGILAGPRSGMPAFAGGALRWLHGVALGAYGTVRAATRSFVSALTVAVAVATLVVVALYASDALAVLVVPIAVGVAAMLVALAVGAAGRWWWLVCIAFAGIAAVAVGVAASLVASGTSSFLLGLAVFLVAAAAVLVSGAGGWRWLAYPVALVSVLVAGIAIWGYADLRGNPSCSASTKVEIHVRNYEARLASTRPTASSCGRAYVDSNRWLVLLCIGLVLPIVVGSRSLARAAAAAAEGP
jgi:Protein of unknown function (DUF3376)/Patatin-like phospholipase